MRQTFFSLSVLTAALSLSIHDPSPPGLLPESLSPDERAFVTLKDFTDDEVKGMGFTADKETIVHITALGGSDRSLWRNSDEKEGGRMFAGGWIIDAHTRDVVWEMTRRNTSGASDRRKCDEEVTLKPGSYEVYFSAHGYAYSSPMSNFVGNIDRREKGRDESFGDFLGRLFGREDMYEEFMELARDDWRITLSTEEAAASGVRTFDVPRELPNTVVALTKVHDGSVLRQGFSLAKEAALSVYALGEGRERDEIFDFGWILNTETRERVWQLGERNMEYAGGSIKNIRARTELTLKPGSYEAVYVTDGSHSPDDWNARPPYDPFHYGMTLSVVRPSDRSAVAMTAGDDLSRNVIVDLTRVGDDDYRSQGFTLKSGMNLHVYCLGEGYDESKDMADRGWIVNARTREKVWELDHATSEPAGGALKNRIADLVIQLPAGDYIAYYETDDSHSYGDWNEDPPYDEAHWGLTIRGIGSEYRPSSVATFSEAEEAGILAALMRVQDGRHITKTFTIDKPEKVRIYALGEGDDDEMYDYGWIEDAKTGETVWEMTYRMTKHAGGARKNRLVEKTITLEAGEYELHYRTDDSHSFNDWNADPPDDRAHWGITLSRADE